MKRDGKRSCHSSFYWLTISVRWSAIHIGEEIYLFFFLTHNVIWVILKGSEGLSLSGSPLSPQSLSLVSCLTRPSTFITCCCLSKLPTPISRYLSFYFLTLTSLSSTQTNPLLLSAVIPLPLFRCFVPHPLSSPSLPVVLRPVSLTWPDSRLKRRNRAPGWATMMQDNKPCLPLHSHWDPFFKSSPLLPPSVASPTYPSTHGWFIWKL